MLSRLFHLLPWLLVWTVLGLLAYATLLDIERLDSLEADPAPKARMIEKDKARGLLGAIERKLYSPRR